MQIIDYIFTYIDMKFYYLQQQLFIITSLKLNNMSPVTFIVLLIAGIVTSLNPCLLSILPVSISYLSGNSNKIKLVSKVMFLAGIISSLIGMILMTSLLSQQYYSLIGKIPMLSSVFTILIALNLLQIINFYDFLPSFNNLDSYSSIQLLQNYSIGLVLGLSSTPCSTPILLTILAWLLNVKYWLLGYIYLFIYCLGYIFPLILLINWIIDYHHISNIIKNWNYIVPISGSCLLGLGIFSLLEKTLI